MTGKIFRSVFYTSVFVLAASLFMIIGVLYGVFEKQLQKELSSEADYISFAVQNDADGFFKAFSDKDKRVTLIAPDGTVIADTKADAKAMENHSEREEFISAKQNGSGTGVRYSSTLTEKTYYYAVKLDDGNVLRVSATQYSVVTVLLGLMQPVIFIAAAALLISLFLSSRLSKKIIKPINGIDLDNPESSETYDELAPLIKKIAAQKRTINAQLEQAVQKQEEFRLITENMSEGFLVIDSKTNLLSCNGAARRLIGVKDDGKSVLLYNRTAGLRQVIEKALSGERAQSTITRADSIYNLIANPVLDGSGKVIGAVIIVMDVTESAQREKLRREFTANVSHELKTPLTSMSGFAELMKDGKTDAETSAEFSRSIYDEAQRLISLVSDIIKISALDEGENSFEKENVNLYELCCENVGILKNAAEKKNVSVNVSGDRETSVYGVRSILSEMVYNLCDNAIKYNKDGGTVDILVCRTESGTELSVIDTGIGISSEDCARVFERFYRVDKSRSKAEGGTGLGLSIVKHAALYHGARISLESEPGEGTTIKIFFTEESK